MAYVITVCRVFRSTDEKVDDGEVDPLDEYMSEIAKQTKPKGEVRPHCKHRTFVHNQ